MWTRVQRVQMSNRELGMLCTVSIILSPQKKESRQVKLTLALLVRINTTEQNAGYPPLPIQSIMEASF